MNLRLLKPVSTFHFIYLITVVLTIAMNVTNFSLVVAMQIQKAQTYRLKSSIDNGYIDISAPVLPEAFKAITLTSMKEGETKEISIEIKSHLLPLLEQVLYVSKILDNLTETTKERVLFDLFNNPKFSSIIGTFEHSLEFQQALDFLLISDDIKKYFTRYQNYLRRKHYLDTGEIFHVEGEKPWGLSLLDLLQDQAFQDQNYIDRSISEDWILHLPDCNLVSLEGIEKLKRTHSYRNLSPNFSYVNLEYNYFDEIPEIILGMINRNLRKLKLTSNFICKLPKNYEILSKLKELDLGYNLIKALPDKFLANAPYLNKLILKSNKLQTLPKDFLQRAPSLTELSLTSNELSDFPDNFLSNSANLENLYLNCNQLKIIPSHFLKNNLKIKKVGFAENKLAELDQNFLSNNAVLEVLVLNGNPIYETITKTRAQNLNSTVEKAIENGNDAYNKYMKEKSNHKSYDETISD